MAFAGGHCARRTGLDHKHCGHGGSAGLLRLCLLHGLVLYCSLSRKPEALWTESAPADCEDKPFGTHGGIQIFCPPLSCDKYPYAEPCCLQPDRQAESHRCSDGGKADWSGAPDILMMGLTRARPRQHGVAALAGSPGMCPFGVSLCKT